MAQPERAPVSDNREEILETALGFRSDLERTARGYVTDAEAQDVVSDLLCAIERRGLPQFDPAKGTLKSYLKRSVIYASYRVCQARERLTQFVETSQEHPASESGTTELSLDMLTCLKRFGPEARQMLLLQVLEGCSIEELSKVFRKSESAVKVKLFRVRQEAKKWLKKGGYK